MGDVMRQNETASGGGAASPPLRLPPHYDIFHPGGQPAGVDPALLPPPSYEYYIYENDLPNYEHRFEFALLIFDLVLIVITLVSNVGMIYFICGQKKARTTHNITIVSIAVSSILTSAVVLPTHLALFLYNHPLDRVSPFLCKMSKYIGYWCKTVTVYSTLGMVMNRYYKAVDPRGQTFLTGRAMFYLNFVWFSGAAYNIWKIIVNTSYLLQIQSGNDPGFQSDYLQQASDQSQLDSSPPDDSMLASQQFYNSTLYQDHNSTTVKWCSFSGRFVNLEKGFLVSDYIIVFTIPFLITFYMFTSLVVHLCKNYRTEEKMKSQGRILMAAMFAFLFFVCQLPLQVAETIIQPSQTINESSVGVIRICETVSFMQGFLNAVAYVACCKEIHHTWKLCIFGPQREVAIRTGPSARVLLRTNSCDNIVETVCLR